MNYVSTNRVSALSACLVLAGLGAPPLWSQYPGQVTKTGKETPELRSIAVLEWTGDLGKPKASRLVPVAVLDGGELQDGSIYMARPEPMALAGEVEYELLSGGQPLGLYDIKNAAQEQGAWVGYGSWKAMPQPKKAPSMSEMAKLDVQDDESDRPVLHRKKHADDSSSGSSGSGGGSSAPSAPADPDRPTLHKKDSGSGDTNSQTAGSSSGSGSSPAPGSGTSSGSDSGSASDPDRPTLHRKSTDDTASSSTPATDDPDRPTLKKSKKKQPEDIGHAEALPGVTDPDRPTLKRGKSTADSLNVVPSLVGLPQDMQQTVAVSDSRPIPAHPWSYAWSSPDDEAKMKAAMEEIARQALGLDQPAPTAAPKHTATRQAATRKVAKPVPPPPPAPLGDEQFRVFELAYGSGATMVLSAHTDGPLPQQKFVTLIAQPDLYGNVLVLFKNVTDGTHLDETPRMHLVDAVDAMADNRGELLFELRGSTQRQFALYRVLRGQAEKLFVGGGVEYGMESRN